MTSPSKQDVKYIYELPYHERKYLCVILDQHDGWEELGGEQMKFDMITIHTLRRETLCGKSPTDALLCHWSKQNHTVLELFVLLSRMQHYQAMMVLKPFVDERYHCLIYEGEENVGVARSPAGVHSNQQARLTDQQRSADTHVRQSLASEARALAQSTDKNLRIDSNNMNVSAARADMASKMLVPAVAGERKILNAQPQADSQRRKGSTGSVASSLVENCSSIPLVNYAELESATNGWSKDAVLGKGGFGTVYKGIWNNTAVAIKRLEQKASAGDSNEQDQLLLRELCFPNSCRHDNILPIYGVSLDGAGPCLVYQLMSNGSVEDRLLCRGRTAPLSWVQRLKIAEGTALGLQFLHTRPTPVIHGDIKSANILLGAEFEPRIADFGLAREGPRSNYTHVMVSRVHGTRPYLPEEFLRSRHFSVKVDTYSFGVVLFELATGLRAYQEDRQYKYLKEHMENCEETQLPYLLDPRAPGDDCGVFTGLVRLGKQCVVRQPRARPDMVGVLQAVRDLTAATESLRLQHQMMQQSLAVSSLAAFHDYVTQHRRGSSPQSSLPHQPLMGEQQLVFQQLSVAAGFNMNPQLPVHKEEEEEPSLQDCVGAMPRFSVLLSLKEDDDESGRAAIRDIK